MPHHATPPVSAHDVARELRRRVPAANQTQIHKWSYYAQAWHLAVTGEPMFHEEIEAYAHGPVVAKLWAAERHDWAIPPPQELPPSGHLVLDLVLETYGSWTAGRLTDQTHREGPWRDLMEDTGAGEPSPVIAHDAMLGWCEASGTAARVRERAFAREDASAAYAAEVDRLRQRSPVGRQVEAGVRLALNRASGREHVVDPPP